MERTSNKEVNRRTLENFIKSGAVDSLEEIEIKNCRLYLKFLITRAKIKKM